MHTHTFTHIHTGCLKTPRKHLGEIEFIEMNLYLHSNVYPEISPEHKRQKDSTGTLDKKVCKTL